MSNNVVSQPLMIPSSQMSQLETISGMSDPPMQMGLVVSDYSHQQFSMPNTQIESFGSISTNNGLQKLPMPNIQMRLSEPMPNNPGFHNFPVSNMNIGEMSSKKFSVVTQHMLLTDCQPLQMEIMTNNVVGLQQLSMSNKRKAPMESSTVTTVPQNLSMSDKLVDQMEHRPWLQQISPTNMMPSGPSGSQNVLAQQKKKMMRTESAVKKPGPVPRIKKTQIQPSPKGRTDLSDSVRSKMREQLAAVLDLVTQQQDKPQTQEVAGDSKGMLPSDKDSPGLKASAQSASEEFFTKGDSGGSTQFPKFDVFDFQSTFAVPDDDVSFSESLFARDELLQGNGLSWLLESDKEAVEIQTAGKQDDEKMGTDERRQQFESPLNLASKIEAELFKLFGGVNKKYKERGRSLLFNLKDRNNPELRERVMSGDIPPNRLCAMTAEELASKELSEWRHAKAEEFASMIVLRDSEVDMKCLVRKTHKGEFQVEYEPDSSPAEDVSAGSSSITLPRRKEKETKTKNGSVLHPKPAGINAKLDASCENSHLEGNKVFTIPSNDGADSMQEELMVDDDLKDLPPIVSLDEFMESLDIEPSFVNLAEAGTSTPTTENGEPDQSQSVDVSQQNPIVTAIKKDSNNKESKSVSVPDEVGNTNESKSVAATKPADSSAKVESSLSGEHVWEGKLQLSISAATSVAAIFKSGEKTSTTEWPATIEIKGRVRLDAFQKFIQALPMSRSRAIMVIHFCCEESSSEELENIREVAASYISDDRLGYAEPAAGVELYLCPPHSKSLEILCKILVKKEQVDLLNSINNGLIGVTVWRKNPHLTSPNKHHTSKRRQQQQQSALSSRSRQDKTIVNSTGRNHGSSRFPSPTPKEDEDDEDADVPPGFGPGVAVVSRKGDDDDLPEFNFSGGGSGSAGLSRFPNQNVRPVTFCAHTQDSRPVDKMRELIQKYGKSDSSQSENNWRENRGNEFRPLKQWNDDDDDIPEWQPEIGNQLSSQANMPMSQQQLRPVVNVIQGQQQRTWQTPPDGVQIYGSAPPPGYGGAGRPGWHQDGPRSRGF